MHPARNDTGARPQHDAHSPRRRFGLLSRGWVIVLALALLVSGSLALATKYVYDDNGRLVVMVNEQSGESARYVYDKVGNLLKIERLAAGQVAVFSFVPARGATGVAVTIQGQGFSTTAGDNVVRFSGVAATVTSATLTELKVTVPAGASTGPLTVTVGTQTVSGPADFVVDEDAQPPQITSVSPLIGVAGTQVTVTGQRLYPAPDLTRVLLGDRIAVPGTSSQTQLTFPVPVRAGSGRITVSTPYGSAQSADEFVVVPAGVAAADVVNGGRLNLDAAPRILTTAQDNQYVALLLDSNGRDLTSLQFGDLVGSVSYSLYAPDNRLLASNSVSATAPSAHLPRLVAGLHLLLLKPSAAASWSLGWEKNAVLGLQAEPLAISTNVAYQNKRYIIEAAAGANLGLGLHDLVTEGSTSYQQVVVYRPDGSQYAYEYCYAGYDCDVNMPALSPGQYGVVIWPTYDGARTLSLKATVSADREIAVSADTPATLALPRRGQNARLSFAAQAGQTFAFNIADQTTVPAGREVYYTVYKPDGGVLQQASARTGLTLNLARLPVAGDYSVYVDPYYGESLTAQATLVSGQSGGIEPGQSSAEFLTGTPGQNIYFSFDAAQGANLGLGISDLITPGSNAGIYLYVYRPDGSQLAYEYCYAGYGGCDVNLSNLAAGTYTAVALAPSDGERRMGFTATLSADAVAPLVVDSPLALTLDRRGQNARLTFSAEAGNTRAFYVSAQSTAPADRDVYYTVYKPDGSVLQQGNTRSTITLNLPNLPATGDYLIYVDPGQGETAQVQAKLVSGQVGGPDPGGSLGSFETQTPGQNVYFSFDAEQGDTLGLALSDLVTPGSGSYVGLYVYRPDGSQLGYQYCYAYYAGCELDMGIPAAGTYNVVVTPPYDGNRTMAFKATLSHDRKIALALNSPNSIDLTKRGENARLSFTAQAGQTFAFNVSQQSTEPADRYVYYTVYKPDGSSLQQGYTQTGLTMNLSNLPVSGDYLIFVDPGYGETAKTTVVLLPGEVGRLEKGAEPRNIATRVPSQYVYLAFTAQEGDNLGLGLADVSTPGSGNPLYVYVYRPDGSQLNYDYCYAYYGGCDLNLAGLAAGEYSVLIVPPSDASTVSFQATLSADAVATAALNAPIDLALDRRGQNGRVKFSAEAGQTFAFTVAGQVTAPEGRDVYYTVYKPDGAVLQQGGARTDLTLNLWNLPVGGDYLVYIDPYYGEKVRARLTLVSGQAQTVTPDGDPGSFLTQAPGQNAYFTFTAEQGANLGLGITDLATPGSTGYVGVYVYRPDGSTQTYDYCYAYYGGCDLELSNLVAGTYSVTVTAPSGGDGTMSFNSVISADVRARLSPDVPLNLSLSRRGQNARLSFAGTAGQTFGLNVADIVTAPGVRNVAYSVYKPDGGFLQSGYSSNGLSLNLANLPVDGQYTVFVDPEYAATANSRVELDSGSGLATGGAPAEYSSSAPWERAYFTFTAEQGANLGLGLSDLVTPGSTSYVSVYVYRPDGSQFTYDYCYAYYGGCELDLSNLAAGTYSVVVTPPYDGNGRLSFKASLSPDVIATLSPNVPFDLALARRGQNGRLSFAGTAGQTVAITASNFATTPAGRNLTYTVYRPDGGVLQQTYSTTGLSLNLANLPASGQYTVFVDPEYGAAATAQVELDTGDGLAMGGAPAEYSSSTPWQRAYFTFTAEQGANLGLGISELITPGSTSYVSVYVYRPDGSQLTYDYCYAYYRGCDLELSNLAAGTYSVVVTPPYDGNGRFSFNATLSPDVIATLSPNVPLDLVLSRHGQNGRLSFAGTAGQTVAINASNFATTPVGSYQTYIVYKPDGGVLQQTYSTTGLSLNLANLPASGQYTVFVDPEYGATATAQVELDTGDGLAMGGAPAQYSSSTPWQRAYFTFTAEQGANLGLGISELITPGSTSYVSVYVYRPDGSQLTYDYCYAYYRGCDFELSNLAAGTYSVVVTPPYDGNGRFSFNATLSPDLIATLSPNVPLDLVLSRRGQNGRLSFAGTAGQTVAINASNFATTPVGSYQTYTVYKPDGGVLQQTYSTTGLSLNLANLPATGQYLLFVDPEYGAAATAQVELDTGDGLAVDGAPADYQSSTPWERSYFTFDAAQGANLGLGIGDLATPGSTSYVAVYLYRPDGTQLTYDYCYASYGGCEFDLRNLDAGKYSVIVVPPYDGNGRMSFKASLSADATVVLTPDVPANLSLARRGQNAAIRFAAQSGQTLALNVSAQVTTPVGNYVYYTVYKPDGSVLLQNYTSADLTMNLWNLPASGDYTVFVDPQYGAVVSAQLTLLSGQSRSLVTGAAAVGIGTQVRGQNAYLTFSAESGADLGLGLFDLSLSSDSYFFVDVLRADGSRRTYQYCYAFYEGCDLDLDDLEAGTYSVVVSAPGQGTMSFKANLSAIESQTLARGVAASATLERRGQDRWLYFDGSAGETLALNVSNQTSAPGNRGVSYWVYRPDGSHWRTYESSSDFRIDLPPLPEAGRYRVWMDPNHGGTASAQFTLAAVP
ncbi:IPT/TIG domain-containing protein [Lysobacter enzymogenes]|uniref:IPT/TIG domain-containing protein n=1 Tax=Lysobacter enzymogenes TaxID=69 RepID=UPI001A962F9A|nr:IPT/TIG domain-containing protein [Lysobacter enzymogenes]QQP98384.1 IPT/TIG domain-containing protein [Lysobacter enzymogenes]